MFFNNSNLHYPPVRFVELLASLSVPETKWALFVRVERIELTGSYNIGEFSFGPIGFVPLGFGSLNNGIWPSIRVFGTQNLGVQTLRVQT